MNVEAHALLEAVSRILDKNGLDARIVGIQVLAVGSGFVAFFDTLQHDPRAGIVARIAVRLDAEEAQGVVKAGRYAPPEVVGSTIEGPMVAIGGNLPAGLGLEIDALVTAARTSH